MIKFQHTEGLFSFRAAGVFVRNGRVLLHRAGHDAFWVLPGGRVEFGEDAAATIVREVQEELLVDAEVERLLWVVENFFEYDRCRCHGLEFYFLLALPPESDLYNRVEPWTGCEGPYTLIFEWFPLEELAGVELYPAFLKKALWSLPEQPCHVVQRPV